MKCWPVVMALIGCASANVNNGGLSAWRQQCPDQKKWNGSRCEANTSLPKTLDAAAQKLADFDVEGALAAYEALQASARLTFDEHIKLYEGLAIARAYLGDTTGAERAFERLLSMSPQFLVSYGLSPKVTLLFERVRKRIVQPAQPVSVNWPRNNNVGQKVPIEVSWQGVKTLEPAQVRLHVREQGKTFHVEERPLSKNNSRASFQVPAIERKRDTTLQFYVTMQNTRGDDIYRWASPEIPRQIDLNYTSPPPMYKRPWFWAAVVGVAAVTTSAILIATDDANQTVGGSLTVP